MMLNEYSRRGWVDGRGLRLPVIVVRPGAPNKALTTCWSSAVREPLRGQPTTLPVGAASRLPCASYQTASAAIEHLLVHVPDASLRRLGHDRVFTLPSLSLSPAELHAAAAELAEARGLTIGAMEEAPTELATRVVQSMGGAADGSRAQQLGLPQVRISPRQPRIASGGRACRPVGLAGSPARSRRAWALLLTVALSDGLRIPPPPPPGPGRERSVHR
eukprot:scaffold1670_cov108-Isochrysis_galbana.AAC.5